MDTMNALREWMHRLFGSLRQGRRDQELEQELQLHLELAAEDARKRGESPEEAQRAARIQLGNVSQAMEGLRDQRGFPWFDSMARDIRLGARMLRKHAVVTSAAVVSLAMALGTCIAAFSLVDALILRSLPVRQPEQLVYLTFPTYTPERPESDTFNDPLFVRLRDAGRGRVDLFAMSTQVMRPARFAGAEGEKEQVRTQCCPATHSGGSAFYRRPDDW
jgi:hypothetical protein